MDAEKKSLRDTKSVQEMEKALAQKLQAREGHAVTLKNAQHALSAASDESRKVHHSLNLLEVKDQESASSYARLEEELKKNQELIFRLSQEKELCEQEEHGLEAFLKNKQEEVQGLQEALKTRKGAIHTLEAAFSNFQLQIKKFESEMHGLDIAKTQSVTARAGYEKELSERYGNVPVETPLATTIEKAERELRGLRHRLESAQDINLAAIEDYDKQKERLTFLETQMADLEGAKQELLSKISYLDQESRALFTATFQQIRQNFQKNFALLFQGGEADLELLEAQDVLEAGIEIIAKPPGKQMRSLSLLSGGEKCLTAMALLFSIFEVKASPFCILDEIDAPLDDSNVERFVRMVEQFIDRCQFIIITHNKRTMALADRLYGVSMQERGVSKLLVMEFAKQKTPQFAEV